MRDTNTQIGTGIETRPSELPCNPSLDAESASELIRQEAILRSVLRPWGKLRLNERTYAVKSEGELIDAGTRVCVSRIEGGYVVVVPAEKD